jgi:NAD(P)-dependent dehydrogenase (short-subunit alcohol dehydrogenase family)
MNKSTKWIVTGASVAASAVAAAAAFGLLARRPAYSFDGKSVFITGGARGLGFLMAELLAQESARLTLISRNGDELRAAEEKLSPTGAQVVTFVCDVRDQQQIQEAIDASVKLFGSIDVLINNAGVIQVGPVEHITVEDFQNAMATHAWGPLYATLAALPHMRRQGGGRIVNISSIGGKMAVPHLLPYSVSKFALAGLSDGMRTELRKYGISVTSVYPGLMRTGSHVHAHMKGNSDAEFAWFSFLATNPLFAIDAQRAAKQIIEACRAGRRELVITAQAKLAAMVEGIAPGLVSVMNEFVNRLLPGPVAEESRRAA